MLPHKLVVIQTRKRSIENQSLMNKLNLGPRVLFFLGNT